MTNEDLQNRVQSNYNEFGAISPQEEITRFISLEVTYAKEDFRSFLDHKNNSYKTYLRNYR